MGVIQTIRKWFGLPDDQPMTDHEAIIASNVRELDEEAVSVEELKESAEKAPGAYQGKPDTDLSNRVGEFLSGVLKPGKKVECVKMMAYYEGGEPQVIIYEEGPILGVHVEKVGDTTQVIVEKPFSFAMPVGSEEVR